MSTGYVETTPVRFVSEYAPDIYEVVREDAGRIGSVQKYGPKEWLAQPACGFNREFATRREAGWWVNYAWERWSLERDV